MVTIAIVDIITTVEYINFQLVFIHGFKFEPMNEYKLKINVFNHILLQLNISGTHEYFKQNPYHLNHIYIIMWIQKWETKFYFTGNIKQKM